MNIFKNKPARVWLIVTSIVLVLFLVINILVSFPLYEVVCIVLGGQRRVSPSGEIITLYESDYTDKQDALEQSNLLTKEIVSEGITLLKNEGGALPLAEGSRVSVFGKNSVDLVYGGSSSGGADNSGAKTIFDSLEAAGFSYNETLRDFYEDDARSGSGRASNPTDLDSGADATLYTGETPQSSYTQDVKDSYADYSDAAIVVISRIGGEGFDLPRTMEGVAGAREETDHFLQLDQNETDLLAAVCSGPFEHVVVILNSANPIELGFLDDPSHYAYQSGIDACLWMAGPGNYGVMALGELLRGETEDGEQISPSGRLVDTYARDFKQDPTWNNFGTNLKANGDRYFVDGDRKPYYYVDYEEGIYVGYRYYETRGFTDGEAWYDEHVVFPFGYGLSYTSFESAIANKDALAGETLQADTQLTFTVDVRNVGDWNGKEVVQLYVTPPYTEGEIEKPHVQLVGFAKTELLQPDGSVQIEIKVDAYDLASYDYSDANGNGFRGYELEAGDYEFKLCSDAHTVLDSVTLRVEEDITIADDPVTGNPVQNLYDDADDELDTVLSRADWEGTWPTVPEDQRSVTDAFIDELRAVDSGNPEQYTQMPTQATSYPTDTEGLLQLVDMMGKDYDDPDWDELLDRITVEDMLNMFNNAAFKTEAITGIGKPQTIEADGPVGWVNFMGSPSVYDTCAYCSEIVLAATWNTDLAYRMGESVGNEGILGYLNGDGTPYSGWYAPGVNIHRSPFGGRNFEYMSEDGFLTGIMAAYEVQGAQSKGVYTYVKHFALNEQETHRSSNGVATWATEQAMRELFLRPFEKVVKIGKTSAMMSSFNRIGTQWTGGDYRLLTTILRDEWGFRGSVICDFNTCDHMNVKQMIYAGGDLNLATTKGWSNFDATSAADVTVLRRATKNVLYTVVNSCAMNVAGSTYILPLWQMLLFIADGVIAAGLIAWGVVVIVRARKGRAGSDHN